jgi:hypothetical protein
MPGARV